MKIREGPQREQPTEIPAAGQQVLTSPCTSGPPGRDLAAAGPVRVGVGGYRAGRGVGVAATASDSQRAAWGAWSVLQPATEWYRS